MKTTTVKNDLWKDYKESNNFDLLVNPANPNPNPHTHIQTCVHTCHAHL